MMPVISNGEVLSAQKVNDYLNHTQLGSVAYSPTVWGASASASARYFRMGKRVEVEFVVSFSGAASGTVTLSTPTAGGHAFPGCALGVAFGLDGGVTSTRRSLTVCGAASGNQVTFVVDSLASSATVTTGVPWVWAAGDEIRGRFSYWEA